MEADGAGSPALGGGAESFDPAKKTIAELKAWLTEQGEENQVRSQGSELTSRSPSGRPLADAPLQQSRSGLRCSRIRC